MTGRFKFPTINEIFATLSKNNIYTVLDLKAAYNLIPLEEESRLLTAFSTHNASYEFKTLPFGLNCAPSTFLHIINKVLKDVPRIKIFMDDILVYDQDVQEHLRHLDQVLSKLASVGFRVNLRKTQFFQKEVQYLGHVITSEGIRPGGKAHKYLQPPF